MNSLRYFNNHKVFGNISKQCSRLLSSTKDPVTERPRTEKCVNRVTLLGRVGRDGEIRGTTENPCLIFPLATNFTYRKASTGEYLNRTDWHRICVFRPRFIEIARSIEKGERVLVEGSLSHQTYQDNDNKTNNVTSVIADQIIFLSRNANRQGGGEGEDNL